MSLFYLISIVLLVILFLSFKKNEREINFINYLVLSFVLIICLNTFLTYIMSIVHLPINLFTLSLINFIFCGVFYYLTKKYGKQKYYYDKKQILACIVIGVVIFSIGLIRTGFLNVLSYETTDSATHFCMAFDFYNSNALLTDNTLYDLYGGFASSMTISYVNIGILFKFASSFVSEWAFFKLFILFDILMLVLAGELFYCTIHKFLKDKERLLVVFIAIAIFYTLGYPLNNFLFGFFYLGISVIIANVLLMIFDDLNFQELGKNKYSIYISIILFLLNFSLFFGYYLFIPVVYAAEFIFIFLQYFKKRKILSIEYLIFNSITLFLPFILGFIYFLLPNFLSGGGSGDAISPLLAEGYIYRDLYSNFVIMIPFILYYVHWTFKNKKYDINLIVLFILLVFLLIIFIMGMFGKSASYYYYKNYYILAPIMFIIFAKAISLLYSETTHSFIYSCFITIMVLFVGFYMDIDARVMARNHLFNPSPKLNSYFDIYANNKIFYNREGVYNEKQLETIKFYLENNDEIKDENGIIPVKGNLMQKYWFYAITQHNPNFNSTNNLYDFYDESLNLEAYLESDFSYYICFDMDEINKIKNGSLENCIILFENDSSIILKRK